MFKDRGVQAPGTSARDLDERMISLLWYIQTIIPITLSITGTASYTIPQYACRDLNSLALVWGNTPCGILALSPACQYEISDSLVANNAPRRKPSKVDQDKACRLLMSGIAQMKWHDQIR